MTNVIKTVIKDIYSVTSNVVEATGTLATVLSSVAADITGLATSAIKATPQVVVELAKTPLTAVAAYKAEENGTDYSEEEAKLLAALPSSASDAVKSATISASRLVAALLKDDEEEAQK